MLSLPVNTNIHGSDPPNRINLKSLEDVCMNCMNQIVTQFPFF